MSSEKRLVLFLVLTIGSMYGITLLMDAMGLNPPPQKPAPPAVASKAEKDAKPKAEPTPAEVAKARDDAMPADPFMKDEPARPAEPRVQRVDQPLIMGASPKAGGAAGYHLEVRLDQRGASVASAISTLYEGEIDREAARKGLQKDSRLVLIRQNPRSEAPWPLAMTLTSDAKEGGNAAGTEGRKKIEAGLYDQIWEVVRDSDQAPYIRTISRPDPKGTGKIEGQEIAFRAKVDEPAVTVTKTYRLWQGEDGFDVELKFTGDRAAKFAYTLVGPYGIPIEGEWYTSTFRDIFFGLVKENTTEISTRAASDVVGTIDDPTQRFSQLPLKFAGVEDQYFATFVQPWPIPKTNADRYDQDSGPIAVFKDEKAPQKSDVGVEITSRPLVVGPNLGETTHTYKVFAGPKTYDALVGYGADELASYRKTWLPIPFASQLAKNVIAPLLVRIYALTEQVSRMFGGTKGNYGIAIILLTMCVRLAMFPLGRKQAVMAKKMQDLQPLLTEAREKYKDDKEQLNKETWAIFKANKVNPASGCLPALIQMPIFVGLWQALNNSVHLRHSSFLYIRDLAAPDMLFKFPFELPLIGGFLGPYFNLLPLLVVALMLIQTKLFSPPATTPEAEMNQKMMKYMMVFMAFMFYKVPSGLGLYFITSSLWQISERLLLPKVLPIASTAPVKGGDPDFGGPGDRGPSGGRGPSTGNGPAPQGWLGKKLEKLIEEANKEKTIRNDDRDRIRDRDRDNRSRSRPGKKR
ncbi:membrane protein insertase YidC [Tundrisphaera sp. TA3]|uniref:membrane protein insertase YidC n=1 Tax=Tundrisphaera sp. TA3 TaxID=3435775 RepID=UPI003EBFB4F7